MLMNKWINLALGLAVVVVGYLSTYDWNSLLPTKGGTILIGLGLAKTVLGSLQPPSTQKVITSTGGSIVTHAAVAFFLFVAVFGPLLGLSACTPADVQLAVSTVATTDNALANVSGNNLTVACEVVGQAETYFQQLTPKIAAKYKVQNAMAMKIKDQLCNNPPSNIVAALVDLNKAWAIIQNATKTS